ncbi:hypothetical protein EA14781_200_00010, partial [Escherichia albertii NBRC 107761 = DSM 17582]
AAAMSYAGRAAVGLTLIETFWNFFRWQKWGKKK